MSDTRVTDAEFEVIRKFAENAGDDFDALDPSMFRKYLLQVRLQSRIADHMAQERYDAWLDKQGSE